MIVLTAILATLAAPAALEERCYSSGDRTGCVHGPAAARAGARRPLIIFLHGYGGDGRDNTLGLAGAAERDGSLYAFAQGGPDSYGRKTWAAIDAAAAGQSLSTDDVAFLDWLIGRIEADWRVDRKRVFVAGWSLGGFMALRFACERAQRVAGFASYAGGVSTQADCRPTEPVSALVIHGDSDSTVSYRGGTGARTGLRYQSAEAVFQRWAQLDGCKGSVEVLPGKLDLHAAIAGAETRKARIAGCVRGAGVELWTVEGGGHAPAMTAAGSAAIVRFLLAHPKR
jgi:polyhydroxybutyrate depolymerase